MKKIKLIMVMLMVFLTEVSYGQITDLSKIERVNKVVPQKYNGEFLKPDYNTTDSQYLGLVGEEIIIIKLSSYNLKDTNNVSIKNSETDNFIGKLFEIIEVNIDDKVLTITDGKNVYLFSSNSISDWYINSYIIKLNEKLVGKEFVPFNYNMISSKSVSGEDFEFNTKIPLRIDTVIYAEISIIERGVVIKLSNGYYSKLDDVFNKYDNGWLEIGQYGGDILVEIETLKKFKEKHSTHYELMRSSKIKVGMTILEVRKSWGIPMSNIKNIKGYYVLVYNQNTLYFKNGKLELIK
jgi:hypothetical protein